MLAAKSRYSAMLSAIWKGVRHFGMACLVFLAACSQGDGYPIDIAGLPNPRMYALTLSDLPPVGVPWAQTYDQYTENGVYKWLYVAFEARQETGLGSDLGMHLAVNNDIVIYLEDVSKSALPQPPEELGAIQDITWTPASLLDPVGDRSAAWQTFLGELRVPVWWLEFYQGHIYGRISLFGFPLDVAPSLGNSLAQTMLARLPGSVDEMRQDATEQPATPMPSDPTTQPSSGGFGLPTTPFPSPTIVIPTPTQGPPTADSLLNYLEGLPGRVDRHVISGQNLGHGEEVVQGYASFVTALESTSGGGRTAAMIGVDYGWNTLHLEQIQAANQVIITHWNRGGLVTISTHVGNPFRPGSEVGNSQSVDLKELLTAGTPANLAWMAQLDIIASGLAELQEAGVVVLWRPFHEMNGGWYWWCTNDYPGGGWTPMEDFAALWQHMFNYFTNEKGLHNLLWVYSPAAQYDQDIMPVDLYYPGGEYVDVVGYTFYSDQFTAETMNVNDSYTRLLALGKPFAITETGPRLRDGSFDTAQVIEGIRQAAPMTTYFLFWHSWTTDGQYRHVAIADNQNGSGLLGDPWTLALGDLTIFP